MGPDVTVREMTPDDCPAFTAARGKETYHFETYVREQEEGRRTVLVAEVDSEPAGYLTIVWESGHAPFRDAGIPEVSDFQVFHPYLRMGVGTRLMDEAERRMAQVSEVAGIGVGLSPEYGPAQTLYVKRGYVPDGRGLNYGGRYVSFGERVTVDHGLLLYLTKRLSVGDSCRQSAAASRASHAANPATT